MTAVHVAWNLAAVAVLVWTLVTIVRTPASALAAGRRAKVVWFLAVPAASVYYRGFYVPIGALISLVSRRLHADELRD